MEAFKIEDLIDEDLVFLDMEAASAEELLRRLAAAACEKGYVREGYADAVLEREHLYPTALPTPVLKVAVPHAIDRDQVLTPVIVVALMKTPVAFKEMGDGERDVPVDIVFMLAVSGSNDQLAILQKIVGMFSSEAAMLALKKAGNKADLIRSVKENLTD